MVYSILLIFHRDLRNWKKFETLLLLPGEVVPLFVCFLGGGVFFRVFGINSLDPNATL